jgi:hypothetical protein
MPKKLTKDQRYNQKKRKEGEQDYKRVPREGKTASTRVTRKALCVRVSTETAERLKKMANDAHIYQWQMTTRIIHNGIPGGISARGYASYNHETGKFEWVVSRLNPPEAIKYKGVTGDKQLNLDIHSTAWNKLVCYANELQQSKARVLQRLILDYKPLTREKCETQSKRRKEQQEYYAEWNHWKNPARESAKKSKFRIDNYEIIHIKGIPVESWDDAEWEEYERLQADMEQRMKAKLSGDSSPITKDTISHSQTQY